MALDEVAAGAVGAEPVGVAGHALALPAAGGCPARRPRPDCRGSAARSAAPAGRAAMMISQQHGKRSGGDPALEVVGQEAAAAASRAPRHVPVGGRCDSASRRCRRRSCRSCPPDAHARVEHRVEDVDHEIDEHEQQHDDDEVGDDHRPVERLDRRRSAACPCRARRRSSR